MISGTRSYAEQDALYRKGRFGNPGPVVTRARGGRSNHNLAIALDIGLFKAGQYLRDNRSYIDAAAIVKAHVPGLAWGGDWRSLKDHPHYELPTGLPIATVRERFEAGQRYTP